MTRKQAAEILGVSDKTLGKMIAGLDPAIQPKPRKPLSKEAQEALGLLTQNPATPQTQPSSDPVELENSFPETDAPQPLPPIIEARNEIIEKSSPFSEEFQKRKRESERRKAEEATKDIETKESIFPTWSVYVAATGLIISDALCFFWIAYNAFDQFALIAGFIFFVAGICVGFAAIKNTADYIGQYESEFLIGFMMFQILLHCCATQVFADWSFFIGKIVISIGTAVATCGLAITLKTSK